MALGLLTTPVTQAAPVAEPVPPSGDEVAKARADLEAARAQLEQAAARLAHAQEEEGSSSPRAYAFRFLADPDRAFLGLAVDSAPDGRGVSILGVTPGAGADKAGIKSGDRMVSIDGKSLIGDADHSPEQTLKRYVTDLKPGTRVHVAFERDGKALEADIVANRVEGRTFVMPDMDMRWTDDSTSDLLVPRPPAVSEWPVQAAYFGIDGLQLAKLNQDLGHYFHTTQGVLVLQVPDGGTLKLRSGDVIQRVNGKAVDSPVQVLELFGPQSEPADLLLQVLREGKLIELAGTLPSPGDNLRALIRRFDADLPSPPDPAAPPAAANGPRRE